MIIDEEHSIENEDFERYEVDEIYAGITKVCLYIILAVLALVIGITLAVTGGEWTLIAATSIVFIFILALNSIVSSDTYNFVFGMSLCTLTALVLHHLVASNGIYNPVIMAMPGLVMVAIIFNNNALYRSLLVFSVLSIIGLGVGHELGYIATDQNGNDYLWQKIFLIVAITIAIASLVKALTVAMQKYVKKLHDRIQAYRTFWAHQKKQADYNSTIKIATAFACQSHFNSLLEKLTPPSNMLACLLVDIKNLDRVEISLGYTFEEKLLAQIAKKYHDIVCENTEVFLINGREFVFLSLQKSVSDIERLASQVLLCTSGNNDVGGHDIEVDARVGVALAPFNGSELETLLQCARLACTSSGHDSSNKITFFKDSMKAKVEMNYRLVSDMKSALDNKEFELYYQPKVDLETGNVVGAEALIRWDKPHAGFISPDDFIPLAEESGAIVEIGKWVLREACFQCKAWHDMGLSHLTIAINVSPVQFRRGNFPYIVMQALSDASLDSEFLDIEVTESALDDQGDGLRSQIRTLTSKGVAVSVDDFGTGYSNLGHLCRFKFACLKVDRSFVQNMHTNSQDLHIVQAILQMSNNLGLENVAEGVENAEHLQLLKALGCKYGQGYYWSKPLPSSEFIAFIKSTGLAA